MKHQLWSQKASIKAPYAKSHLWQCSHTRFDSKIQLRRHRFDLGSFSKGSRSVEGGGGHLDRGSNYGRFQAVHQRCTQVHPGAPDMCSQGRVKLDPQLEPIITSLSLISEASYPSICYLQCISYRSLTLLAYGWLDEGEVDLSVYT